MSEDLKIIVSLVDSLSSPLGELKDKVNVFSDESKLKIASIGDAFKAVEASLAPLIELLGAVGIAFGTLEIGKSFLEAAENAEVLKARLDTFTNGKGSQAFEELSKFAVKMGISINDATNAFITMSSSGVKPTEVNMQGLIGATEALKGGFDIGTFQSITSAIGMVGQSAKSANSAFRMLGRMGIDAYDIVEKQLHMTSTQIDNLAKSSVGAGQIQEALLKGLTEKYGSTADKIAMTWKNMWQSIKDEFELFEEAIMNSGAFQYLEGKFRDLMGWLKSVEGQHALEEWAQRLGTTLMIIGNVIAVLVNTLRAGYNGIMIIIHAIAAGFWSLVDVISQVVHIITASIAAITNVSAKVANAIAPKSEFTNAINSVNNWAHTADRATVATQKFAQSAHTQQFQAMGDSLMNTATAGKALITNIGDIGKLMGMLTTDVPYKTHKWPPIQKHAHGTAAPPTAKNTKTHDDLQKQIDDYIKLLELMSQEEEAQAKLSYDSGQTTQIQYEQKLIEIRTQEISVLKEASALEENSGTKYIELKTKIINLEDQNAQALKKVNELMEAQSINIINSDIALTKLNEANKKTTNVATLQAEIADNKQLITIYEQKLTTLQKTDAEYANTANKITQLVNANQKLNEQLLIQTGTFQQGITNGFNNYVKNAQTAFQQGQILAQNAAQSMTQALGTSFFDVITGKLQNLRQVWAQFFASIAQQIAQMIAQMLVVNALKSLFGGAFGGGLGFANGGVVNGLQIGAFASGGIVGSPTLALIGEGAHREAIVPLPDGKSIPVQMHGNDNGGGVNVVNVLDNSTFTKWANTLAGKKTIRNIVGGSNKSALDWS